MTAIVDYGVGNLFSIASGFRAVGEETAVTGDPEFIAHADRVVLPGVGAFGTRRRSFAKRGLTARSSRRRRPVSR